MKSMFRYIGVKLGVFFKRKGKEILPVLNLRHFAQPKIKYHVLFHRSFSFFVFDFEALSNENRSLFTPGNLNRAATTRVSGCRRPSRLFYELGQ